MSEAANSFHSFSLSTPLLQALEKMGFHQPSEVQSQTIPHMLEGRDIIALAQTGTGKTAAFALPLLEKLDFTKPHTQALILAPTRELAIQVGDQIKKLGQNLRELNVAILCGGQDYRQQLKPLKAGAQIVVGTPGRVLDHIRRNTLKLQQLSSFILDEADEMLRMGFIEDVETILAELPNGKQLALFSATMPTAIRKIAAKYLSDAINVEIRKKTATVQSIEQKFLFASYTEKPAALLRILAVEDFQAVIVFTKTKTATEEVCQYLQQQGHRAMAIHGDITQNVRERIIQQFRQGGIDILVATDVAARGLDVERVSHVINYDVPFDCETYVHRIGRTGRAGRSGVTILFISPNESRHLYKIEKHTRQPIQKIKVPDDKAIAESQKTRFLQKIQDRLDHPALGSYRKALETFMQQQDLSAIDVAAALALYLQNDKDWHQGIDLPQVKESKGKAKKEQKKDRPQRKDKAYAKDKSYKDKSHTSKLDFNADMKEKKRSRRKDQPSIAQELFRLEVGKNHGVKAGNIIGALANEGGLDSRNISGLRIYKKYSTVELPKDMPKKIFNTLAKAWVCGQQLNLSRMD